MDEVLGMNRVPAPTTDRLRDAYRIISEARRHVDADPPWRSDANDWIQKYRTLNDRL